MGAFWFNYTQRERKENQDKPFKVVWRAKRKWNIMVNQREWKERKKRRIKIKYEITLHKPDAWNKNNTRIKQNKTDTRERMKLIKSRQEERKLKYVAKCEGNKNVGVSRKRRTWWC